MFKTMVLVLVLGILSGCGTMKGIAHDVSWAADKVDQAIVVPE